MALYELHGGTKKKARPLADAVSTYGLGILPAGTLDYETRVGLILNQQRVEKRRALIVLEAIASALAPIPDKSLFQAAMPSEEQGAALFELEKAKQEIESARRSFDGPL